MVRRSPIQGPFRAPGPFWALCMLCMFCRLISYGAPEGVPQDIGPGYSVETSSYVVAVKEGTPREPLRTRRFQKEPSNMSPMAAPCARPPVILEGSLGYPLGLDSGPRGQDPESDLVAEPVPVPVAIPHVLTPGWWSGFATGLGWFQHRRVHLARAASHHRDPPHVIPPLGALMGPWF